MVVRAAAAEVQRLRCRGAVMEAQRCFGAESAVLRVIRGDCAVEECSGGEEEEQVQRCRGGECSVGADEIQQRADVIVQVQRWCRAWCAEEVQRCRD